jgi:hypothetical protein
MEDGEGINVGDLRSEDFETWDALRQENEGKPDES